MTRFVIAIALLCPFIAQASSAAEMQYPMSAAAGPDGAIYVADKDAHSVWKIADGKLEVFFQGSNKFRTPLNAVWCVAVDSKGRVLAGDSATREVYRFDAERKPEPLTKGGVGIPWAMAFDGKGDILVCDMEIHQIVRVPEAGGEPVKVAEVSGAPRGIAVDAQDRIWVVDNGGKDQVLRVLPDGTIEKVVEGRPFQMPHNIALDKDQNAYVCDNYGETVWKIEAGAKPGEKPQKWITGKPLIKPVGISFTGDHLLIADPHAKKVFEASLDGKISAVKFESPGK